MELQEDNIGSCSDQDWAKEVAAFEETKAGVKGLADSGILKIPTFFIRSLSPESTAAEDSVEIPTVDLRGVDTDSARRKEAVEAMLWGIGWRNALGEGFRIIHFTV